VAREAAHGGGSRSRPLNHQGLRRLAVHLLIGRQGLEIEITVMVTCFCVLLFVHRFLDNILYTYWDAYWHS